jgi:hypothetical protein
MNIVVIGGGTPGKFGNDFCNRAKSEGHDVYIMSHIDHGTNDPKHIVANFNSPDIFLHYYKKLIQNLDTIDILLYNSNGGGGIFDASQLQSIGRYEGVDWEIGLKTHVIIPHMIILESLKKMSKGSGIVFMTTDQSYNLSKTQNTSFVGYAGFKGIQNHLMIGLAYNNDKEAIATSVSTHFPYENKKEYDIMFDKIYNYITTLTDKSNGKIRSFWKKIPEYLN